MPRRSPSKKRGKRRSPSVSQSSSETSRKGKASRKRSRSARREKDKEKAKDRGKEKENAKKGCSDRKRESSRKRSRSVKKGDKKRRSPSGKRRRSRSSTSPVAKKEKKGDVSQRHDRSPSLRGSPRRCVPSAIPVASTSKVAVTSETVTSSPPADPVVQAKAGDQGEAPRGELVLVTLGDRPFGMSPSKEVAGYVVAKLAELKPADKAGVQVGWRVVEVAGTDCRQADNNAIQALLKNAILPVQVVFEKPLPLLAEPTSDSEEEGDDGEVEDDLGDARADHRKKHAASLSNIDDLPVTRDPDGLPEPISSWQDAVNKGMLSKPLFDKLQAAGLKRPTLIQKHTLPIINGDGKQAGYDMIALAQTGSGKTFAFVIPTVARLVMHGATPRPFFPGKSPGSPLLLVLSPTRELAMQTFKEIEVMTKGTNLLQCIIYGGESLKFQSQRVEKAQIDVLCATPGRLIDLIDAGKISLSFIQSVVLDEADQMLEQSLEIMCAEILTGRDMPDPKAGRQTLLFSATMPQKIRELCPKILRQDRIANLTIGHYGGDQGGSCKTIKQILKWAPDESSRPQLLFQDLRTYWIDRGKVGRVVIFTNQRVQAGILANNLSQHGLSCVHLHGKLEQHVREEVFDKFRRGQGDILVATNVASRGLDFPDITFVVQYQMPGSIDVYTHRIGRTGRVGQVGTSLAYVGPKDRHLTPKLIEFLTMNEQEIPSFLKPRERSPPRRGRSRDNRDRRR